LIGFFGSAGPPDSFSIGSMGAMATVASEDIAGEFGGDGRLNALWLSVACPRERGER
jgi:hypothetical protein